MNEAGRRIRRFAGIVAPLVAIATIVPIVQAASGPLNDLLALGEAGGQTPALAPIKHRSEPPLEPTPQARCGPASKPEPGVQGRVPAGSAKSGLRCNVRLIGRHGSAGGFRVHRYVDEQGQECAYYDTALLLPLNALRLGGESVGVKVLDMSDPARPKRTATLTELPMMTPHESLSLNQKRGLIGAVTGSPVTYPGLVSFYDASEDCRRPVHRATAPVARFGHEGAFSPDGKTFYAAGTAVRAITAIDVSDPSDPHPVWHGVVSSHGMTLGRGGNRAYIADATGANMLILDTSEIQARRPNPRAQEVSRLSWEAASIPQNAIPFRRRGRSYVLEFDEYTAGTAGGGDPHAVGAARIIDIENERRPRVISNLRLEVNQPEEHAAAEGDPGAQSPVQGYAAHYCDLAPRVNPKVVACSFIASGLRVFDISRLRSPREIGYFVAPTKAAVENGFQASNFAMSQPVVVAGRREVWFTDGVSGFYVLRVSKAVWPKRR